MSKISIAGASTGSATFTIESPATSTNRTITIPDATTTLVGTDATQTLTNKTLTSPTITGANMSSMASSVITSGTSQASTSGTSIDFTGIPSWVKRITVMLDGVSTNSTSNIIAQLGDSGGIETTGYAASLAIVAAPNNTTRLSKYTAYFGVTWSEDASYINYGSLVFTNLSGNTWTASGVLYQDEGGGDAHVIMTSGAKTLSATLDRVRISTAGGTATFDAGSINILYE